MTNHEAAAIIARLRAMRRDATPSKALAFLVKSGIATRSGRLARHLR